jgi:hypothetical protein
MKRFLPDYVKKRFEKIKREYLFLFVMKFFQPVLRGNNRGF